MASPGSGSIVLYVFLSLLCTVTVIGNIISIFSFSKNLNMSGSGDVFMLNLAVADLLVGLVSMPGAIAQEILGSFPFGLEICKTYLLVDYTIVSTSSFSIVLISYDRYLQIVRPHDHRAVTARHRLSLLFVSWLLAFLVYGPAILAWDVDPDICEARYQYESKEYTILMALIEFLAPFSLMFYLYVQVHRHAIAWRQRRTLRQVSSEVSTRGEARKIRKFNRRLTMNLTALLVAFLICWLPYIVSTVVMAVCFCEEFTSEVPVVVDWLLWGNSAINPFLYAFFSLRQRSAAELLPKCFRGQDEDSRVQPRSRVGSGARSSGNARRMTL